MYKALLAVAILFGGIAIAVNFNGTPNVDSKEFWQGAPNITYRMNRPGPDPTPVIQRIIAGLQPVAVDDGKIIRTEKIVVSK